MIFKPNFSFRLSTCGYDVLLPTLLAIFDGKYARTACLAGGQVKKLVDEVVQGGLEVVCDFPDENWDDDGNVRFDAFKPPGFRAQLSEGRNLRLETIEVFLAPSYSRAALIKSSVALSVRASTSTNTGTQPL